MASRVNISGLPFSFTNAQLRRIFVPFGTVELAQVLRDAYGRA
jgi:RNA recognition motif-containing protein